MTTNDYSPRLGADARLLSTHALAEYLDVSPRTVIRWRESLTGPPYVRVGTTIRYRPADIEKWLSASIMKPLHSVA